MVKYQVLGRAVGFIALCLCMASYAQLSSVVDSAWAPDTIAGQLPDTVRAHIKPYLVSGDIEVPSGKTVIIEPGTTFLFKGLTGLHVQGKLLAQGSKERPIIFTSENDRGVDSSRSAYPNPYDWNGIYLHSDATGTVMQYCKVLYSVYGIVSETKYIRLDPIICLRNGKSNLVIDGKLKPVTDAPFRYVLSVSDVKAEGVPVRTLNDPYASRRSVMRYAGFAGLLAAGAGGAYFGEQWLQSQKDLTNFSGDDPTAALRSGTDSQWHALQKKRNNQRNYSGICGAVAALSLISFVWSFRF